MLSQEDKLRLKNITLLYVEDNKKLIDEVNLVFDIIFNKVYIAKNGLEALEVFDNNKIDIIITDINMPNMSGIDLIKEIRSNDKVTSIIVLTAHADKDLLLEASNLQIDGYLTKPINFDKISDALSNALKRINYTTTFNFNNGMTYDTNTKTINNDMVKYELGKKEAKLLHYLLLNSHRLVSKDDLISHIWDMDDVTDSALKNLLSNLRSKIGKDTIVNHAGHGWQIKIL